MIENKVLSRGPVGVVQTVGPPPKRVAATRARCAGPGGPRAAIMSEAPGG